jgi:hypothetical protein
MELNHASGNVLGEFFEELVTSTALETTTTYLCEWFLVAGIFGAMLVVPVYPAQMVIFFGRLVSHGHSTAALECLNDCWVH